jgi:predicted component of type VI protein secretion system
MNDANTKLADLAWSKMEALSKMRKFIQNELDFLHSSSQVVSPDKFYQALTRIDGFTSEFSKFLTIKRSRRHEPEYLEQEFEALSAGYVALMRELENTIWH